MALGTATVVGAFAVLLALAAATPEGEGDYQPRRSERLSTHWQSARVCLLCVLGGKKAQSDLSLIQKKGEPGSTLCATAFRCV